MHQLLTYGLHKNELKHILEVQNGLSCMCVCPHCTHPLVAKNNEKNSKTIHFAHYRGKECDGAIETALHLLAKAILRKTKKLLLPDYHSDYNPENEKSKFWDGMDLNFDDVVLEAAVRLDKHVRFVPDAIGLIKKKQIYIEFANTHFVDIEKKEKVKNSGVACIEIDLRGQILEEISLTNFLNTKNRFIYWIFNPRLDEKYKLHEEERMKVKALELERKKREPHEKYKKYGTSKEFKLLQENNGQVSSCPLKGAALNSFKTTNFFKHEYLKIIIDGQFWNGMIYGQLGEKYIYLKNKKIQVYPDYQISDKLLESERKRNDFFYKGLRMIEHAIKNKNIGDCANCKFNVDYFILNEVAYQVCSHSND